MAKKKRAPVKRRRRSVTGTTHRRRSSHRKSKGMLGGMPADAGEKVIGISLGAVGVSLLEGMVMKKKPNMNPMVIGAGEMALGLMLSGNGGMESYVGDGMIAAGAMNLFRAMKMRHGGGVQGAEYVINGGPNYVTGHEDMYITGDGYVITGAGEYITGPDGQYITSNDLVMGDVNQGGLGDVNQGGLGGY